MVRLATPVQRVYHRRTRKMKCFYTLEQYRRWAERSSVDISQYDIHYYKGLASHDKILGEVEGMFIEMDKMSIVYDLDEDWNETLVDFYDKPTAARKRILSRAPADLPRSLEDGTTRALTTSVHLTRHTASYMRDNILRKLPRLDGLIMCRRKIMYCMRSIWSANSTVKARKVDLLGGQVTMKSDYQHGNTSLMESIKGMAHEMLLRFPYIRGRGMFGTRSGAFKDSGAARYIKAELNRRLTYAVFPAADDALLHYPSDDGEFYEPTQYCPVIPTVLLEDLTLPSNGWKVVVHAREMAPVLRNVRLMIETQDKTALEDMPISLVGPMGVCQYDLRQTYKGNTMLCCRYTVQTVDTHYSATSSPTGPSGHYSRITVRSLLPGQATETVKTAAIEAFGDDLISVDDYTSDDQVDIRIMVNRARLLEMQDNYGAGKGPTIDVIMSVLKLTQGTKSLLNLVDRNGDVVEYGEDYRAVFLDWFQMRRDMYTQRISRQLILLRMHIILLESLNRFSRERQQLRISDQTVAEIEELLTKNNFPRLDAPLVNNSMYIKTEDLMARYTNNESASYKYILQLTVRQTSQNTIQQRVEKITALQEQIAALRKDQLPFVGANTWLSELDTLEQVIHDGAHLGWNYGRR